MKNFFSVTFSVLLTIGTLFSQSIERQVFNSFGAYSQGVGFTITINAGEPLTQTYFTPSNILTQGFIQPETKDFLLDFSEAGGASTKVHIWPNPATEGLFVSYQNIETSAGKIMIYDMNGKCLIAESICVGCQQQYVALPALADGVYVVRVALSDKVFKDEKFIKVSQ